MDVLDSTPARAVARIAASRIASRGNSCPDALDGGDEKSWTRHETSVHSIPQELSSDVSSSLEEALFAVRCILGMSCLRVFTDKLYLSLPSFMIVFPKRSTLSRGRPPSHRSTKNTFDFMMLLA